MFYLYKLKFLFNNLSYIPYLPILIDNDKTLFNKYFLKKLDTKKKEG